VSDKAPPIQVLMMPDYRQDNPYQRLLTEALESNGAEVAFPSGYRRVFPFFRAVMTQPKRVDILHLHWLEPYMRGANTLTHFFYAVRILIDVFLVRLSGTRIVWTIHNQLEHEARSPRLELWVRKVLARLSDRLILHNQIVLQSITQQYQISSTKAVVIPHGHYRDSYQKPIEQTVARELLNLPQQGRIYLSLGMLRPYKGIENLLESWQANQDCLTESTLLIVGQPMNPEYGQQLAALVAETKNVLLYPSFVEDDRIHLFFSAADVVVLPYKNILTSGSVILAMSFGKPVIAPKRGSIPEVLGNANALLYESDAPDPLSQALQKSVHCDLQRLSQQTVEACHLLNWEQIGEKTVQVYEQCICKSVKSIKTSETVSKFTEII
jgi:glycosyltransferase involved in cell wall biosynthesis